MPKPCMSGKADSAESSNNLINQPKPVPLMKSGRTQENDPFVCYRCSKRFSSLFALGGHQNAHKKERNEELRAYMVRRLALEKERQSSMTSPKPPTPLTISPRVNVINSMPFHGPIVQPPTVVPAAGYERQKAPVLFVPDARLGPFGPKTSDVVKDGEGNQNCYQPYKKPVNKQSVALKLFAYEERDFRGTLKKIAPHHQLLQPVLLMPLQVLIIKLTLHRRSWT